MEQIYVLRRFDPYSLLNGLRKKAVEMGVTIVRGEAVGFEGEDMPMSEGKPGVGDSDYHKLKRVHVCRNLKNYPCVTGDCLCLGEIG